MLDIDSGQNSRQRLNKMLAENNNSDSDNFKMGIILLSIFILILLIIFTVYLFRSKSFVMNNKIEPVKENIVSSLLGNSNNQPSVELDTDKDGLTDKQELDTYKTDLLKADTDSDGLTDREEVVVYKTDPLKADTDGDGISDGQEIKARHNPLDPSPSAEWPPRPNDLPLEK